MFCHLAKAMNFLTTISIVTFVVAVNVASSGLADVFRAIAHPNADEDSE